MTQLLEHTLEERALQVEEEDKKKRRAKEKEEELRWSHGEPSQATQVHVQDRVLALLGHQSHAAEKGRCMTPISTTRL